MGTPFMGEIRMVGFPWAPVGWSLCDGALLPISEHDALYALLGTTWGGDGQTTFGLPNMQGRVPINAGQGGGLSNRTIGESAGVEYVTLSPQQTAAHTHAFTPSLAPGPGINPAGSVPAQPAQIQPYIDDVPSAQMAPNAILPDNGGSQPHDNMMPFQCINFIIALEGIFPSGS